MYALVITDDFEEKFSPKKPAAFFDIDHTIIIPSSGKKMYSNKDNYKWKFMYDNIVSIIKKLSSTHTIYFVTNQLKYDDIVETRFKNMLLQIEVPALILVSTERNVYRKPGIGLVTNPNIPGGIPNITEKSFHVGDAAGRSEDFSDDDLWFAINSNINFYTPEEFFIDNSGPFFKRGFDFQIEKCIRYDIIKQLDHFYHNYDAIMLIGLPGSGKSYIRKWYLSNYTGVSVFNNDENLKGIPDSKFYILDNTNLKVSQRKSYPSYIINSRIATILLDINPNECIRGIKYRVCIEGGSYVPDVTIRSMNKNREIPEKLDLILNIRPILDNNFPPYLL